MEVEELYFSGMACRQEGVQPFPVDNQCICEPNIIGYAYTSMYIYLYETFLWIEQEWQEPFNPLGLLHPHVQLDFVICPDILCSLFFHDHEIS